MTAEPIEKIVVFTADPNFSVHSGIRAVLDAFDSVSVHVLVHRPKRRKSRLIRNQFRNLKKHGIAWIPYQAGDVCARVLYRNEPTAAWPRYCAAISMSPRGAPPTVPPAAPVH